MRGKMSANTKARELSDFMESLLAEGEVLRGKVSTQRRALSTS
jgi:hypothetical protein